MNFIEALKRRWEIRSTLQVVIILVVFACTGFSLLFVKAPFYQTIGITDQTPYWIRIVVFVVALLPIYNVLLLGWGFVFGQFRFFWNFEMKMFRGMVKLIGWLATRLQRSPRPKP